MKFALRERFGRDKTVFQTAWLYGYDVGRELGRPTDEFLHADVMPVTKMPLTPRLKRVWRRINKAKGPPSRAPTIPRRTISQ